MLNDVALNHLERRGGREGDWERACTFGRTFLLNLAARHNHGQAGSRSLLLNLWVGRILGRKKERVQVAARPQSDHQSVVRCRGLPSWTLCA